MCLKECLLTDQNLFRILTKLNQNNIFFSRILSRMFNNIGTLETHDRAVADKENYGKYSTLFNDEEEEKVTGSDSSDVFKKR